MSPSCWPELRRRTTYATMTAKSVSARIITAVALITGDTPKRRKRICEAAGSAFRAGDEERSEEIVEGEREGEQAAGEDRRGEPRQGDPRKVLSGHAQVVGGLLRTWLIPTKRARTINVTTEMLNTA